MKYYIKCTCSYSDDCVVKIPIQIDKDDSLHIASSATIHKWIKHPKYHGNLMSILYAFSLLKDYPPLHKRNYNNFEIKVWE